MADSMEVVRLRINGAAIRAAGKGLTMAVAVTDDEIVTGRAGFLGRWGAKVERYRLDELSGVTTIANPSANLLKLEFGGDAGSILTIMYGPEAVPDFERLITLLERRLSERRKGTQG